MYYVYSCFCDADYSELEGVFESYDAAMEYVQHLMYDEYGETYYWVEDEQGDVFEVV